jgi:hypothetical protein
LCRSNRRIGLKSGVWRVPAMFPRDGRSVVGTACSS